MTQNEKNLLVKDLSQRLPYGIIVECNDDDGSLPNMWKVVYINIFTEDLFLLNTETTATKLISVEDNKPYLFPLTNITDEQREEFLNIQSEERQNLMDALIRYRQGNFDDKIPTIASYKHIDWLNANHFDYKGLIEMCLAIDCTNLNIY